VSGNLRRVLITVPSLAQAGGVANYYRVLRLDQIPGLEYLEVTGDRRSGAGLFLRLMAVYARYAAKLVGVDTVMLNPSMQKRAVLRDSLFALLARATGRRLIVFWRGWEWNFYRKEIVNGRMMRWWFRQTLLRTDTTITLGTEFESALRALDGLADRRYVRETTVADDSLLDMPAERLSEIRMSARNFNLLFMSRLVPNKGLNEAIRAYEMVRATRDDVRMSIAGDGPELAAAQEYVRRRGIPDVTFAGHVEGVAKHELLLDASLLLFPSMEEGLPNVLLEAMLYGMPVVTLPTGGIGDVVTDRVNGLLAGTSAPRELARLVLEILDHPELRQAMVSVNQAVARDRFVPAKVAARLAARLLDER